MTQSQLDTKALQVANTALTKIKEHEKHDDKMFDIITKAMDEIKQSVIATNEKVDAGFASLKNLWLGVAGSLIGILLLWLFTIIMGTFEKIT